MRLAFRLMPVAVGFLTAATCLAEAPPRTSLQFPERAREVQRFVDELSRTDARTIQRFKQGQSPLGLERGGSSGPGSRSLMINYSFVFETADLFSMVGRSLEDDGNGHPVEQIWGALWDKQRERRLRATDLLRSGVNMKRLNQILCDKARTLTKNSFVEGPPGLGGYTCPTWALAHVELTPDTPGGPARGLTFLYAPFEIGRLDQGDFSIDLSAAELQDVLSPLYASQFERSKVGGQP